MSKENKYFDRPKNTGVSKLVKLLTLLDTEASELFEVNKNMLACGETSFIKTRVSVEHHNAEEICKDLNKIIDDLLDDIKPIQSLQSQLTEANTQIENMKCFIKEHAERNPYPKSVFTEPTKEDWEKLQKMFKDNGLIQDRFFGEVCRNTWNNVHKEIQDYFDILTKQEREL